ncbi:MAG TPA: condensation domain-containing protein, partial [Longimicrobium sp.]|nr:condensation domain-containing protein [Longimicrobium sp.]
MEPTSAPSQVKKKLDRLARLVRQATGGDADRIHPRGSDGPAPLSFGQERLWLLNQLDTSAAAYNVSASYRYERLDAPALERALGEVVRRHEALRTVFREADGAALQVVVPFTGFTMPVHDLSALEPAAREAEVRRRSRETEATPFDLAAAPLLRATLLRLGEHDVLLLDMHHIASDGWSLNVLFRELGALYTAYRQGGESPLAPLEVQYADYAVWQRARLQGEALERQLAWWRGRLAGAPAVLELPTDRPRPAVQTYRGAREAATLPMELLERLRGLARDENATPFMVLLAAFQVLLGKYAGTEDVVVGTPVAGRSRGETEGLIGFFVNTLVLRTELGGDPGFREVLRRVREVTLGAYEHQEVPFERLVAELQPERSLSHAPLFQVMFTAQSAPEAASGPDALPLVGVAAERTSAQFDLTLSLTEMPDGLRATAEYSTDLFDRATMRRMLVHLERLLQQVVEDADRPLSALSLLDDAERARVVDEWNRTDAEYPADRCIHAIFEAQAARTPDAVAVAFEDRALTYAQLNAQANRIAHHLARRGVGPEVRVGLFLERGIEMVAAILGVLKAGGAYVPLDPSYPADRVAFALSDASVPVLLTEDSLRDSLALHDGVEIIRLDAAADAIAEESTENPQSGATPESLAYVIYTSGSTGT